MNRRTATSLVARLSALALALALLLTPLLCLAPATLALAASPLLVSDCSGQTGPGQIGTVIGSATAGDTITFSCSGSIPISSTLTISQNLTLDGSGQSVTLDGGLSVGVLLVNSGVSFTLNALTIAHGLAGGLYNNGGTVSITNSTFSGNAGAAGGGLYNNGGTVSITNSTFSDNVASGLLHPGAGLGSTGGTVTINNSTFANNRALHPEPGGGLFNGFGTVMSISNSTVVGNSTRGLYNAGTLTIRNSTVVGNSSEGLNNAGTLTIRNSTVVGNGSQGLINVNVGTVTIGASIMANNTWGNCVNDGTITSQGYNLESGSDCGFTGTGDLQNTDPKLASALASNGGATQTLALLSGSPAIDHIPTSACTLSTDQRGVSRPQGPACDIGAFEFEQTYAWAGFFQPIDNLPTLNSVKAGSGVPVKFSLGGDFGLNIFAAGYPKSQTVACTSGAPTDDVEQTVSAGASSLQYDAATGQYSYTWKTEKSWAGTCRQLIVRLSDGTEHMAGFTFK
jgi:Right handed beta helix region